MSGAEFAAARASLPADLSPGTITEADIRGDIDPDDVAEPEATLPAGPADARAVTRHWMARRCRQDNDTIPEP
jgi:hypothetical protein